MMISVSNGAIKKNTAKLPWINKETVSRSHQELLFMKPIFLSQRLAFRLPALDTDVISLNQINLNPH